ncbi:MAG: DUF1996 domain-containing protein [Sphingomonas phyllosphaerae]
MKRLFGAALAALCLAAPIAAQGPTLKREAPPVAAALGEPQAKTWQAWREQYLRALSMIRKPVGDIVEPELGADFTKVPASIPTNQPIAPLLSTGWPPAVSGKPDTVGAFRFLCAPGQVSRDDPIVFPNQPGKSHLHQWFGNLSADASSTYESLRTKGDSTCVNILNRSAYWMPAMLNGKGMVVRPDYVSIYYKHFPAGSADCASVAAKGCTSLPRGLRMIFGYDMQFGTPATGSGYFNCDGPTARSGHYATITEAAKNCPAGNRLGAIINAPQCWDGKRLDSPNHRDHVGYAIWRNLPDGRSAYSCDPAHPYAIPGFTMGAWYSIESGEDAADWYLSSDEMPGMARMTPGSTFHADWFGAWDDDIMAVWMRNCIDKLLSCNSGDLGDGRGLKQTGDWSFKTANRLVPIPALPQ